VIGSSLLLWLSVSVIKKQSCIRYSKGTNLGLKFVRMRLAAGLRPDPLGELERSPRPSSRNWWQGCLLLRGREGMRKGNEGVGREEGKGREEGNGREGRRTCIPHYF